MLPYPRLLSIIGVAVNLPVRLSERLSVRALFFAASAVSSGPQPNLLLWRNAPLPETA